MAADKNSAGGEPVLVETRDGIVRLTLNRPDQLNAFNEAQHRALRGGLERARDDENCRVVVLTGAGRGFCAGQDLSERDPKAEGGPSNLDDTLDRLYNPLVRLIRDLPKPVIAAVNGVAAGAGANIALACDMVIAARSARFIQAFCKLGLVPDSGGTWTLPRLVGQARAKGLMLTGEAISAEDAERFGMIWKAVDADDFENEVNGLAEHFAAAPTFGLGLLKQAVNESMANSLDAQLDLERDLQARAGKSRDFAEGVSAFLEKRAPKFTGREKG